MANPLITQGTLNRLRASVVVPSAPTLNITASYLGKEGIRIAFDGNAVTFINTMVGAVTSPEPYQMVTITLHLIKTQGLASVYKKQWETNAQIGNITVRPDTSSLPPFGIQNCAIENVPDLDFSGASADFPVTIRGYYTVNSDLYDS